MADSIPADGSLDASIALMREGFEFVSNRCRRLGTDAFRTRLMGRRAVCMQGAEAARAFYTSPFTRRGALPRPVLGLIQDVGSVAVLDGAGHRVRKRMFLDMMAEGAVERLERTSDEEWTLAAVRWGRADHVVLLPAVEELLCRTACAWAGVPLGEPEAAHRTRQLAAMIDGAGSLGLRNLRGHLHRRPAERWAAGVVRRARAGAIDTVADSALAVVASHTDGSGRRLDQPVAAVELLNVIRPAVAVARFVVFAAMALHEHPELRVELQACGELLQPFVQEVRRFYPFFPVVAGRALAPVEWRGQELPTATWVMLDLYGTNRDKRAWDAADEFRPQRFVGWPGDRFTFVPQGGGGHADGHRCPGEWMTIALMRSATRALAARMRYSVPEQDLRIRPSHMPPRPESGFVIRDVLAAGG